VAVTLVYRVLRRVSPSWGRHTAEEDNACRVWQRRASSGDSARLMALQGVLLVRMSEVPEMLRGLLAV
jgi:hypothetical protein